MAAASRVKDREQESAPQPKWVSDLASDPIHSWVGSAWDRAAAAPGSWFDEATAQKACDFFPTYLRLTTGRWTGRPFTLAPWQSAIVRMLFGWKRADGKRIFRRAMIWVARKNGKGLALNTPLPTPSGWTTMGQVAVGDLLYDELGAECRVTAVSEIHNLDCYEIDFSNGEKIVCDGDHLWPTTSRIDRPGIGAGQGKVKSKKGETLNSRVRDTRNLYSTQSSGARGDRNHALVMPAGFCGRDADLPIDPYVLGLWLGDGSSQYAAITMGDSDKDELTGYIRAAGVPIWLSKPKAGSAWLAHLTDGHRGGNPQRDCIQKRLRSMGILNAKRIPSVYLRASAAQRLALLQGLMDSDGYVAKSGKVIEVVTVSETLGFDIGELLAGLGIKFSCRIVSMRCNRKPVSGNAHRFQFCVSRDRLPVFRLKRKLARQKTGDLGRSRTVQIVSVRKVPSVPTKCIQVSGPSHQFRCGRTMLPTHNSEFAAGLLLLAFLFDGEMGGEAYVIANNEKQARIVFGRATLMVQLSPTLPKYIETFKTSLYCPSTISRIKPLSGQAEGKHGLSCSVLVGDEMHEWKDGDLYQFVHQSELSREQPLDILISTAGQAHRSHGWVLWEESLKIRDGTFDIPSTLVVIYAPEQTDDWRLPETWAKANPNLGSSIDVEDLRDEYKKAVDSPRLETDFKRYYLNLWVGQDLRWIDIDKWREGSGKPTLSDDARWRKFAERMKGRECFGALDLSSVSDLTCLLWLFPPQAGEKKWIVLPRFWVPADNIERRARRDRVPYDIWRTKGAIEPTEGNVVDYDVVIDAVHQGIERFAVKQIGYDPYNATATVNTLMKDGVPLTLMRQGIQTLGGASKQMERLTLSGLMDAGGHPVMDWMVSNVAKHEDAKGNILPDKAKSSEKIDGISALVMNLALAGTDDSSSLDEFLANAVMR